MPKGHPRFKEPIASVAPVEAPPVLEEVVPELAPEPAPPPKPAAPIEELAAYAARIERQAQPLAVCMITHPHAVDGTVFDGVYAGIRLAKGDEVSAQLSDGSVI